MSGQLEELRGALSGRYTIERELGTGGMGTVYQVHDAKRRETVALKTLRWVDPAAIYRFKQEFRALADVSHGNLVQLHELVAQGDVWFFTMELVAGETFVRYVRPGYERVPPRDEGAGAGPGGAAATGEHYVGPRAERGTLDLPRLRDALRQLIQGVAALHAAGIVHRDLKPSNVLVTSSGRVVVLDFGLATEAAPSTKVPTVQEGIWGTVEYMAPEQCMGERCTPASDWYAVGALLYEALAGRLPFSSEGVKLLLEKLECEPPRPDVLAPDAPPDLVELCVALMTRDPSARPTDDALRALFGLSGTAAVVDERGVHLEGRPLVGRARHLARLDEAFAAAGRGEPVAVCVRGPSGIGKTALVRHFTDGLAAGGRAVVLAGRCFVSETVPYKALDGTIDMLSRYLRTLPSEDVEAALPADTPALARVFPVLRRVEAVERRAVTGVGLTDPREIRRRAFTALTALLATIAQRLPLVLHIDDLQWADRDSADVLNDLLRGALPGRVLFVLCVRTEDLERTPYLVELMSAAARGACRMLDVEPLAPADAEEYARRMLGGASPDTEARARALAREAGGNPFLLDQIVRAALATEGQGAGKPGGLAEMLETRLRQMPAGAPELVRVLAIAGRPLDARVAYRAAGLTGDERPLVTRLRLAHIVRAGAMADEVDLYHDRIREAVVRDLAPPAARTIHRRLATELEQGAAGPESLYEHCLGAGDRLRAAAYAARAAAAAQTALAFERAALFYRRAIDLRADRGPATASWQIGLGDALASAGRCSEAAVAYLDAKPLLDERGGLEMERRAGQQLLISGQIEEGLEVLGRVLARVRLPQPEPSPRRALLALLRRRAWITVRGLRYRPRAEAEVPADTLARIDTCWAVAEGLAMVDNIQGAAYQALHLRLALDAGEPTRIGRALAMEAGFAATTGAAARAARVLREAERLAQQLGSRPTLGLCRMMEAASALHRGQFEDAERLALEAEAILAEHQGFSPWPLNIVRSYHVGGLIDEGKIRELCRVSGVFLDDAVSRGNRFAATIFRTSWSILRWLSTGDLAGARAAVADAKAQCSEDVFYITHLYCMAAQALVDLYAGDDPAAAYGRVAAQWPALERSMIMRIHALAVVGLRARAACALAAARVTARPAPLLAVAAQVAARLRRLSYSPISTIAWPEMLDAAIALARGDRRTALTRVGRAVERFAEYRSGFYLAIANWKKGELVGGDEGRALIESAHEWMTGEGIVDPKRMADTFVPWPAATAA